MSNTITTDLSSVITKATEKATKADSSHSEELILDSQIKEANKRADTATKSLDTASTAKQEAQDKLSPPPMKTETSGGKGKKTVKVVDEAEKDKLTSQVRAADTQIQQAQGAVDAAHGEAADLTAQKNAAAALTPEQKGEMDNLTKQLEELKKLAADPKTDQKGSAYQDKLNSAVANTEKLYGSLPESGETSEFWKSVKSSFKTLDDSMKEFTDIDPPPITSTNKFFQDAGAGFDKVLNFLGQNGVDQALITQVTNGKDSLTNQQGTYLDGVTADDKEQMSDTLYQLLLVGDKIDKGESVTNADIATLLESTSNTAEMLSKGGSAFEQVASVPFNSIEMNLAQIDRKTDDPNFQSFYSDLKAIYNAPQNDFSDLKGITKEDMQSIYDFATDVKDIKDKLARGESVSAEEMAQLVNSGRDVATMLTTSYGMVDGKSTAATNPNDLAARR